MSRDSQGSAGWFKWLVGVMITLLAAGSGIVALLNYFNPPQAPTPTPAPLEKLTYVDDHVGWAGKRAFQNSFDFYIDRYSSDYHYFLTFQVVTSSDIQCGETSGTVSIEPNTLNRVVWNWNNTNVNCYESSEWNFDGLSPESVVFAKDAAVRYGNTESIDITRWITKNDKYEVTWQWVSGCCGIVINGMKLEAVPAK
jgi:hypothetical protein